MMGEVEARGYPIHGTDKVIIGNSPPMQHVYGLLDRVGPTDMNVLIRGETGTGKELVALALHHSRYQNNGAPFVPVNCAAVPADLLESQFFGHKRGAFTGAHSDQVGYVAQADGGTLFLDEIGDMPPGLQMKLLRFLDDHV